MKSKRKILMLAFIALLFFSCQKERFIYEPGNLVPRTVDQDPGLPSITVNGAMLHSEAFGNPDGTMIVCIHGGPGSDYRSLLNLKDLVNYGYRVVFYDQRGSGLSQRFPKQSYTSLGSGAIDMIYDELGGVIAHYRTSSNQKVFLIGHSWGGILATAYTGKHPTEIQGLVVADPGGLKWDDVVEYMKTSHSFNIFGEFLNDATYLDQFITGKEDQHEILDYKLAMLASNNYITGEAGMEPGSFWRMGTVINGALLEAGKKYKPDFSDGISNFNVPVLFFYTEKNKAYPDSWAQKISGVFNTADLFKVMGVGHSGIFTDKKAWKQKTLPKMLTYFHSL
jgi:proline iminopeptidase